ncbi:diguanylate cyclase [Alginatibacterium sediminis]|uniref:Diguanylate cyclase n=2 Tax=Alginatibacterium sediminis TaxID=2164068 RepID=A0A420EAN4_9ALTE|nr:diguanylate cyclase [Alginatibacterium sediminis]
MLNESWDVMQTSPESSRLIIEDLLASDGLSIGKQAECNLHLGWCEMYSARPKDASNFFLQCIDLYHGLDNLSLLIKAYNGLGSSYAEVSLFQSAITAFNEALSHCKTEGFQKQSVPVYLNILLIYTELENLGSSKETLKELDRLITHYGADEDNLSIYQSLTADVYLLEGKFSAALEHYTKSLEYARHANSDFASCTALIGLSRLNRLSGKYQLAQQELDEIVRNFKADSVGSHYHYAAFEQGLLHLANNNVSAAIDTFERSLGDSGAVQQLVPLIRIQQELSDCYSQIGEYKLALDNILLVNKAKESMSGAEAQQQLLLHHAQEKVSRLEREAQSERKMRLKLETLHRGLLMIEKIGRQLASSLDLPEIVSRFYQSMKDAVEVDAVAIGLYDVNQDCLDFEHAIEFDEKMERFQIPLNEKTSLNVKCFKTQKVMLVDSTDFVNTVMQGDAKVKMKSGIYMPLSIADERLGVLTLQSSHEGVFQQENVISILNSISDYLSIAIRNGISHAQLLELRDSLQQEKDEIELAKTEIEYLALHDGLTQLPNRRMLLDCVKARIYEARLRSENFYLLYLDLNRFKPVNDLYGHSMGDKLLISFAERVRKFLRSADLLSRIGGDEFVILLSGHSPRDEIDQLISRLQLEIERPFLLESKTIAVSASIGLSCYPEDGESFDSLLHVADLDMYQGKARRKAD